MVTFASILSPALTFLASIDFESSAGMAVPGGSRASLRSAWDGEDVAGACDAGVDGGGDVCDSAGVAAKATATNNARGGLRIFMVNSPLWPIGLVRMVCSSYRSAIGGMHGVWYF